MRKPRLSALMSKDRLLAVFCGLCLLGPALISLADTPFSLLYRHMHSHDSLVRQAMELNGRRMLAARDYFLHSYYDQRNDANSVRGSENLGSPWTGGDVHGGVAGGGSVGVAVGVVTVRRHQAGLGYLLQSAAALQALLSRQRPGDLLHGAALFVCNVDPDPDRHADAVFLRRHLPYVERYGLASHPALNVSALNVPGHPGRLYGQERQGNVYDKERYDYMLCLQAALGLAPRYVLLVEDDALVLPDMPQVVQHALDRLERLKADGPHTPHTASSQQPPAMQSAFAVRNLASDHQPPSHASAAEDGQPSLSIPAFARRNLASDGAYKEERDSPSTFVYLKLLYPLYWQGFAFELARIVDLVSMAVVLSALVLCVVKTCMRRRGFPTAKDVAVVTGCCLVLCLLAGRQNVNELRRLSAHLYRLEEAPGCCTPAVLYPADVIAPLVTSLAGCRDRRHVDLCIQEFVKDSGLPAYIVQPNLFSHVGMVTSLKMRNKPPEELLFHRTLLSDAFPVR